MVVKEKNILFADTRSDKVAKIAELKLDIFIDDLKEVFDEPHFPDIKKILFSEKIGSEKGEINCRDWYEIEEHVLGWAEDQEIVSWLEDSCDITADEVRPIYGGGNNRLFWVKSDEDIEYAVKIYPNLSIDPRPRLDAEVLGCKLTEHLDVTPVMQAYERGLNFAVFDWIEGASPDIDEGCIQQAVQFAKCLKDIHCSENESIPLASEACLSVREILHQVDKRVSALDTIPSPDLTIFIDETLGPLRLQLEEWVGNRWSVEQQNTIVPLARQTLSPSDFGFHNALQKKDGTLCFFDFEYFGRDDPVKLIADFIWHPGMNLSIAHKTLWLREMFSLFDKDPNLVERFITTWPLFGLRWALILLNEFGREGWRKRIDARHRALVREADQRKKQLEKAAGICQIIEKNELQCPYV